MLIEILVAIVIIALLVSLITKRRPPKLSDLKKRWHTGFKDGWSFERFMADLFNTLGYKAVATKGSHDFGVDLFVKNGKVTYIFQVKYYSNTIPTKALEEALMAAALYGVDRIGIITNAEIPEAVRKLAQEICNETFVKKVVLISRSEIERMLAGEKLI